MNKCLWVLAAFALGGCEKSPAAPPAAPTTPITLLAFGDSLTAGKDLDDPDTQSFPAQLERRLRERGHAVRVVNAGQSGDTTFDGLARLDFSLQEKPQVVLLNLGSNDTFQGKSLEDIERNLRELVRRSRASGAKVLLCAMKTFPNLGPFYADRYDGIFPRVAREEGAILVPFPLEGVAGVPELNLSDGIHPNPRGYARVADNILPSVEKILSSLPAGGS